MHIAFLILHIAAGGVGILSGAVTLAARKGGTIHRASGTVFFISMLTMACAATALAITIPDWSNLPGGLFAFYLVATGWATLRPNPVRGGAIAVALFALVLAAAVVAALLAWKATGAVDGLFSGKPAPLYGIFATLALFAAAMDVKVRVGAELVGRRRIARHVWRMCTALFFGTGSFFLGQQKVMPLSIQGSPMLFVLALAPLVLMTFWLLRMRFGSVTAPA